MKFYLFLISCFFYQRLLINAEEVEVVEAIPSDELNDHMNKINDKNDFKSDQLVMDGSVNDQNPPPQKKLTYNGPPPPSRNNPPPRIGQYYNHKPYKKTNFENKNLYNGPPPPPPPPPAPPSKQAMDKYGSAGGDIWPTPVADMPKIVSLDVKCEKNSMKVYIAFDKPFLGIVFSKGHYSNPHCVHLPAGLGRTSTHFEIGIHACGTSGNTENGLYGYGAESGSGTYFENIIVIQYDSQVQEVWDQARKLRCTWHDQYEKSVTFRPFPVDMLDVVRTDFAGDNVGCWMQIQVGKGPWASEVSGLVKIGQTMTMVLAIKDDDNKFDMLVRNCMAHDGKRAPIPLVDQKGCVTRPKLMSRFTKIKNFGASASVLSYAHFQAFKFPDSMEVHFQCTIQICRYHCPDQCSDNSNHIEYQSSSNLLDIHPAHLTDNSYGIPRPPPPPSSSYDNGIEQYLHQLHRSRDERKIKKRRRSVQNPNSHPAPDPEKEVGVNRIIRVVSTGDFTFSTDDNDNNNNNNNNSDINENKTPATSSTVVFPAQLRNELVLPNDLICMTTPGFAATLIVLLAIMIMSCVLSAYLFIKLKRFSNNKKKIVGTVIGYPVPVPERKR